MLQIQEIDPIKLRPHPDNAKIHTDKQIDRIAKSMENTGGSIQPIVVDEGFVILAGHGRWMAHKKRGDILCPVVVKAGLTDAQKRKFLLADNQTNAMTGNSFDMVAKILGELDSQGVSISDIGFSDNEIDKYLNFESEAELDRDLFEEASTDPESAFELKESLQLTGADCVSNLEIPMLMEDMIPEIGNHMEFVVWMNRHRTPPLGAGQMHYHLFGRESTKGLDPSSTLMSFYIDDVRFERVWTKLRENTQRFINAGVWALTMPDFTCLHAWPKPKNLWNMYRSYYTALYWQRAGLMVVPNLVAYDEESMVATIAAIPPHAPVLSKQIQTISGRTLRSGDGQQSTNPDSMRHNMGILLDALKPESLIVYGGAPGLTLGQEICKRHNVRFIGVANRATASTDLNTDGVF